MTSIQHLPDLDATPHAAVFPGDEPKTIRLVLDAGERVDPHRHPGRDILFYLVDGAITLHLGADTFELEGGDVARFDGEQEISPVATEASTALVVLAHRPGAA